MKTCCLCGTLSDDGVETCPNDGEASWAPVGDVVAPKRAADETTPADDAPKKRGRR